MTPEHKALVARLRNDAPSETNELEAADALEVLAAQLENADATIDRPLQAAEQRAEALIAELRAKETEIETLAAKLKAAEEDGEAMGDAINRLVAKLAEQQRKTEP